MNPPNQARHPPYDSSSRQGRPTIYPPLPQDFLLTPLGSNTEDSLGTSSLGSKNNSSYTGLPALRHQVRSTLTTT